MVEVERAAHRQRRRASDCARSRARAASGGTGIVAEGAERLPAHRRRRRRPRPGQAHVGPRVFGEEGLPIIAAAVRPDPADAPYASGDSAGGRRLPLRRGPRRRAAGGDGTGWVAAAVCICGHAEATSPIAGRRRLGLAAVCAGASECRPAPALPRRCRRSRSRKSRRVATTRASAPSAGVASQVAEWGIRKTNDTRLEIVFTGISATPAAPSDHEHLGSRAGSTRV